MQIFSNSEIVSITGNNPNLTTSKTLKSTTNSIQVINNTMFNLLVEGDSQGELLTLPQMTTAPINVTPNQQITFTMQPATIQAGNGTLLNTYVQMYESPVQQEGGIQPLALMPVYNTPVEIQGTANVNVSNASIPVSGNVNATIQNASIPVSGTVEINSTTPVNVQAATAVPVTNEAGGVVQIGGTVQASITNASIPVTGNINATVQNAELSSNIINASLATNPAVKMGNVTDNVTNWGTSTTYTTVTLPVSPAGIYSVLHVEIESANATAFTSTYYMASCIFYCNNEVIYSTPTQMIRTPTNSGGTYGYYRITLPFTNPVDKIVIMLEHVTSGATLASDTLTFYSWLENVDITHMVEGLVSTTRLIPMGQAKYTVSSLANGSTFTVASPYITNGLGLFDSIYAFVDTANGYTYNPSNMEYCVSSLGGNTYTSSPMSITNTFRSYLGKTFFTYSNNGGTIFLADSGNITLTNANGSTITSDTVTVNFYGFKA